MSGPLYKHVVEIGAGDRASSEALAEEVWRNASRITLYEPNRVLWKDLVQASDILPDRRVMAFNAAVAPDREVRDLYHMGYASYLFGAPSFLATSVEAEGGEAWWEPLLLPVSTVYVDHWEQYGGVPDLLILTANGSELGILQQMQGQPKVIRTKAYMHNARQVAYYTSVHHHLNARGYRGEVTQMNQYHTFFAVTWRLGG